MSDSVDDRWSDVVRSQPAVTESERQPGAVPAAVSFTVELADERLLLKIKREDGRIALVELTPDMALYLREYLSNALATIGYGRPES